MPGATRNVSAAVMLATSIVAWATAPVFIRFLSGAYDPFSQSFVRYSLGSLALVAVCLIKYRRDFLRLLGNSRALLGVAALNTLGQTLWTVGTYHSTAIMAQLIVTLNIAFVIAISYFLFREERSVIASPKYLMGTMLSLAGVTAVLAKNPGSIVPVFDLGAVLLLATAVCWGSYKVWSKHLVMGMPAVPMFTVTAVYTSAGLGLLAFVFGDPACIPAAGWWTTGIAFVSGLLPIALAHPAYNYAQRYLGAAFSGSCHLLVPLFTYLFGMLLLGDENLTGWQWVGGGILLAGTGLVTFAGQRRARSTA